MSKLDLDRPLYFLGQQRDEGVFGQPETDRRVLGCLAVGWAVAEMVGNALAGLVSLLACPDPPVGVEAEQRARDVLPHQRVVPAHVEPAPVPGPDESSLAKPFAWAMIRLDGADVPMVHCVAASGEEDVSTGARVRAVWADETKGFITDIRCFELV